MFFDKTTLLVSLISLLFYSCSTSEDDFPTTEFNVEISQLPVINGFKYEGWLNLPGGQSVSFGEIEIDSLGNSISDVYSVDQKDLIDASTIFISLEPISGDVPTPSNTILISGDFIDGEANLSANHFLSFNSNFENISGDLFITPNLEVSDTLSGMWLYDTINGSPTLSLPTLSDGWRYNMYVDLQNDILIGTGQFNTHNSEIGQITEVIGADGRSDYSENEQIIGFPGEEFLINSPSFTVDFPLNLKNKSIYLVIEPTGANEAGFLDFKLLSLVVPESTIGNSIIKWNLQQIDFPNAIATK